MVPNQTIFSDADFVRQIEARPHMERTALAYFHATETVEKVPDRVEGKVTNPPEKIELSIKKVVGETIDDFTKGIIQGELSSLFVKKVDSLVTNVEIYDAH